MELGIFSRIPGLIDRHVLSDVYYIHFDAVSDATIQISVGS